MKAVLDVSHTQGGGKVVYFLHLNDSMVVTETTHDLRCALCPLHARTLQVHTIVLQP